MANCASPVKPKDGKDTDLGMPATTTELSLEEQVRQLTTMLCEAQKLTALGELTSTTTHEFNNLLMTVINYAKLGLRAQDAASREKSLAKILESAERAARITHTILGMARNRRETLEPTDLATLIDDTLLLLEREMRKYRVRVERRIDKTPCVMANGNQIQQVLLNLLINARQAMPDGGRLLVALSCDPASSTVDLMVRDSGKGIAEEHLRHIFDPFFSTKSGPDDSGKGGTGLGLSSCRSIIESHRGRIRVESTLGKGTAFIIKLPVAKQSTGGPSQPALVQDTTTRAAPSIST